MWQIEDLLRAYHFDLDKIKKDIVDPYPVLWRKDMYR